jgi:hypothetical protein
MTAEPTVLDYIKSLLTPWKGKPLPVPPAGIEPADLASGGAGSEAPALAWPAGDAVVQSVAAPQAEARPIAIHRLLPWPAFLALGLALLAQSTFDVAPQFLGTRNWVTGAVLYGLAIVWMIWAYWRGDWTPVPARESEKFADPASIRWVALAAGILLALVAYVMLGGNRFTTANLFVWLLALALVMLAFWLPGKPGQSAWLARLIQAVSQPQWTLLINRAALVTLIAIGVVIFFRVYRLGDIPSEMVSDHTEKLLDVQDLLNGQTSIFFPRNTGREAIQFYLTAAIAKYLGAGLSHISLKIGAVLAGLLTLPYLYLLGKEVGNRWTGLAALFFAGVAYWPNVISRFGLRFPFYPLFAAPVLYYLLKGLRTNHRNDFVLAGLFLGLGLHGYTPFRIMPFVVVIAIGLYLLHRQSKGVRQQTILGLAVITIVSFMVFLPLFRFWREYPDMFQYRAFTRLSSIETPLPGPAWQIFFQNLWRAMMMFFWDDGSIWVVSVTYRPALDLITAALFALGMAILLARYIRRQHWQDLFLVLAVPLLMMPSILSLAFPDENPAVNRASGAMVPVFIIVAIALQGLLSAVKSRLGPQWGVRAAWGLALVLSFLVARQNYDLVFNQYYRSFTQGAWNTSEMGAVIKDFATFVGTTETSWVVARAHWVDTILVGVHAGDIRNFAIWPAEIQNTLDDPRPKLFLFNSDDADALNTLQSLYPQGNLLRYDSNVDKDFMLYFVPPAGPMQATEPAENPADILVTPTP